MFGFVLTLYSSTACRTFDLGDSAELVGAAATFGIAHPPGYPMFVLICGSIARAFWFISPAFAINLCSALFGALTAALMCRLLIRLGIRPLLAAGASVLFASHDLVWSQAIVAEVYTLDLLLLVLAWTAMRRLREKCSFPAAILAGAFVGSWLLFRPVNLLYLPGLVLCALLRTVVFDTQGHSSAGVKQRGTGDAEQPSFAWIGGAALGAILSVVPVLFLSWRSRHDPFYDAGDTEQWANLLRWTLGIDYRRHLESGSVSSFVDHLQRLLSEFGIAEWLFAGLAGAGIASLARKVPPRSSDPVQRGGRISVTGERRLLFGLLYLVLASLCYSSWFQVADSRVFFLPGLLALAILAAFGLRGLGDGYGVESVWRKRRRGLEVISALACALPGTLLNYSSHDLREYTLAETFGVDLLQSAASSPASNGARTQDSGVGPKDGAAFSVLFARGDYLEPLVTAIQAVDRRCEQVIVVDPILLFERRWYQKNLVQRYRRVRWPELAREESVSRDSSPVVAEDARKLLEFLLQRFPAHAVLPLKLSAVLPEPWNTRGMMLPAGLVDRVFFESPPANQSEYIIGALEQPRLMEREVAESTRVSAAYIALYHAQSCFRAGEELLRLGRTSEAIRVFQRVIDLKADRCETVLRRAFALPHESWNRDSIERLARERLGAIHR